MYLMLQTYTLSGVSTKFEVGSQFEKVCDGIDKYLLGGSGCMPPPPPPQKNLKSESSETLFPAFWASNCAGINIHISMIS